MAAAERSSRTDRRRRGDFPTPEDLVRRVVTAVLPAIGPGATLSVLDPACGDGRFLAEAARQVAAAGARARLTGIDIDRAAVAQAQDELSALDPCPDVSVVRADALTRAWGDETFDVVVGNPPYLSPLATENAAVRAARGGAGQRDGGAYADAAAEFLALCVRLARPAGGRVGLVLPQSILASRDAGVVRADIDRVARRIWAWWSPDRHFDADVIVCALGFERVVSSSPDPYTISRHQRREIVSSSPGDLELGHLSVGTAWTDVVTDALGIPPGPELRSDGTFGERMRVTANFRDQYYGLVPVVVEDDSDDGNGGPPPGRPPFVTSGLIDPATCRWGCQRVTFARQAFQRPCVRLDGLTGPMRRWADGLLVPKVLVANQTGVIECVADPDGHWLPGVPVLTARVRGVDSLFGPADPRDVVWEAAAVLTSPVASVWAWHQAAGTGLSARTLRLGPRLVEALPWPAGDLTAAVKRLQAGDVPGCGRAVDDAYGAADDTRFDWWAESLPER